MIKQIPIVPTRRLALIRDQRIKICLTLRNLPVDCYIVVFSDADLHQIVAVFVRDSRWKSSVFARTRKRHYEDATKKRSELE